MRHLDLFSGIGGFALAARNVGWQTVAFCESEPFCQAVLRKHWPDVPIHNDVRELTADAVGSVDIITGGYPCQPFSLAGERRGKDDDRHLWPEFARLIRAIRPSWAVGENVAGHITMGLDDVLTDLEGIGYSWEAFVIPAVAVDARHRRDRLWIVANSHGRKLREQSIPEPWCRGKGAAEYVADRNGYGLETNASLGRVRGAGDSIIADDGSSALRLWNAAAPPRTSFCGVADGLPARVDRLRALGNAIVPQVAEEIFRAIDAVNRGFV